jgi:hypothetical protein
MLGAPAPRAMAAGRVAMKEYFISRPWMKFYYAKLPANW